MAQEIIGKIAMIGQSVNVSKDGTFMKRLLVLDASRFNPITGEKYDNYPSFFFTGDKCSKLDSFNEGDVVKVSFVLSGRKYEKDGEVRYFTDIVGYDVTPYTTNAKTETPSPQTVVQNPSPVQEQPAEQPKKEKDDLPF